MPHHGSKENEPHTFLRNIKTTRIGISTNGKTYGHPDEETLHAVSEYMKTHGDCKLYFTSKTHRFYATKGSRKKSVQEWLLTNGCDFGGRIFYGEGVNILTIS